MKVFAIVFTLINLLCVQVLAGNCQVMCELNEMKSAVEKPVSQAPMKANHECCHGNSKKEENKNDNPFQCMGDLGGVCLHEASSSLDSFETLNKIEVVLAVAPQPVFYSRLILSEAPKSSSPPVGVDHQFIKFKEGLRLHILKDQFLI